ncbi:Cloroperoxidase [Lentinula aciculospora]|uniref:Cloroperoxidase n=1 Tax=Lentinula aciculospora TaxID=153920 RepID=A0A9W9AQA6_9AGAR|nr:Cloroperoxidase [Lentinula aciculospora]
MNLLFTCLVTLAVSVGVKSDDIDWSVHQWEAPTSTDSRGPCPGLNTNGSNITVPVVLNAINDGFNFEPINLLRIGAKLGLLTTDAEDSFSLNDLALHGTLEHDVSLSRNDYALGDNVHFNETIFSTLANSNPGVDYYNITSAAQVLEQRLAEDQIANPTLVNTVKELAVREVESAFYLGVMGNVTTGIAPKNFVQIFFREERLPLEEGWELPQTPINQDAFDNLLDAIANVTTWAPSGEKGKLSLSRDNSSQSNREVVKGSGKGGFKNSQIISELPIHIPTLAFVKTSAHRHTEYQEAM